MMQPAEKRNKETENGHERPVTLMQNCLEESREIYSPVMYIKAGPFQKE